MQQKELEIREKEAAIKDKKVTLDAAARADEIRLKEQDQTARQQLEGTKLGIQIAKDKDVADRDDKREGMRLGVDIAKHKAQMQTQSAAKKENK